MDEYEKLEEELKKAYEVIIAGSIFFSNNVILL